MKRCAWLLIFSVTFSVLFTLTAFADDDKEHHHHEDLTETQLGTVHFPVSCAAAVQTPFARGVALLHSFWYEEAEKEFLEIAKDDPNCAMAHWGIALSIWHQLWNEPDAKVIARGLEPLDEIRTLAQVYIRYLNESADPIPISEHRYRCHHLGVLTRLPTSLKVRLRISQ